MEQYKVLFDGHCNLCNTSINFIVKRDKKKIFRYIPIQKVTDVEVSEEAFKAAKHLNTILLLEDKKIYTQSTAILRVCKHIGGWMSLLYGFIIVPKFIRDGVYRFIARNRYKWFGKSDACEIQ